MDTIILIYKKRGLKEPVAEPVGMRSHMLVRVALDVGNGKWFKEQLGVPQPLKTSEHQYLRGREPNPSTGEGDGLQEGGLWGLRHPFRALGQRLCRRKEKRLEREQMRIRDKEAERLAVERAERAAETEMAMRRLTAVITELAGDLRDCFCVYEDSVRKELVGRTDTYEDEFEAQGRQEQSPEHTLAALWGKCFQVEEFSGYLEQFWVEQLLDRAVLPHFVILGMAPCVYAVIEECVDRMKSLRWILPEEDCGEELLDFVEDFYVEYGLAVALQPVEGWTKRDAGALRRLRLVCEQPASILDFTNEERVPTAEIAQGSVWVDMQSVEEKERRIEGRSRGITYVSLKTKWRKAQRPQPFIPASK